MHTVDVVAVCISVTLVVVFSAIVARQRFMLRATGSLPLAVQRGHRWLYGVGRYNGSELRFYRALGVGSRPSRVLRRGHVEVLQRRSPLDSERGSLPPNAVVVICRADAQHVALALGESAFTGFVSWLESSAPP